MPPRTYKARRVVNVSITVGPFVSTSYVVVGPTLVSAVKLVESWSVP